MLFEWIIALPGKSFNRALANVCVHVQILVHTLSVYTHLYTYKTFFMHVFLLLTLLPSLCLYPYIPTERKEM